MSARASQAEAWHAVEKVSFGEPVVRGEIAVIVTADPVSLANELRPVLVKLSRHLRREVHSLGVTGGPVSLLGQIPRHPGIGVRELAHLEGMSPPPLSGSGPPPRRPGPPQPRRGRARRP